MRDKYLYNTGKPFNGPISINVDSWRTRISKGKPAGIIICAPPGRGKTTLAVHFAREYLQENIPIKDICDKYLGNGFKDTLEKLDKLYMDGGRLIIYDEAGDVSKRRSLSQVNYEILQVINKIRGFNMFVIMIMQDFSMLDGALLTSELFRAGFYIDERHESYSDYSCYDLDSLGRIRYIMSETLKHDLFKNKAFVMVEPNFWGQFKNLMPEDADYLHKFSIEAKIKSFRDMMDKQEGLMTQKELAQELGRSTEWIYKTGRKLDIKPAKRKGRHAYYSPEEIERFRGEM